MKWVAGILMLVLIGCAETSKKVHRHKHKYKKIHMAPTPIPTATPDWTIKYDTFVPR